MTRIEEIRQLFDYHRWANGQVLDAVAQLGADELTRELGGSFPSLRATLVHVLSAEWVWLQRWQGTSPAGMPATWNAATPPELLRAWSEVQAAQAAFVGAFPDERLDEVFAYRTTEGDPKQSAFIHTFRHVVNHGTYHRGQVVNMLRILGRSAPSTDLILFYRMLPQTTPPAPSA